MRANAGARWSRRAGPVVLLGLVPAACKAYQTSLDEFDSISPIARLQAEPTGSWTWSDPPGGEEEDPARLARETMSSLSEDAAGDLQRSSEIIVRLLWVADRDPSPLNRIYALRGMSLMIGQLGLTVVRRDMPDAASAAVSASRLAALAARSDAGMAGGSAPQAERQQLLESLDWFSQVPLATRRQCRELIVELDRAWQLAADAELSRAAERALRNAMQFATQEIYLSTVRGDSSADAPVRRFAIAEIHRQGGQDSVAWILAITARSPDPLRPAYDPSVEVLRDLVRLCGQLNRELALQSVPGGPAPAEFLWELISAPASPRSLKLLSLEALALSLGRPVSFEREWADEWYRRWNEERLRGGRKP